MIGTLEYMAPEQLMGGSVDGRSDIYTLGVVAYEMITGRRPFADAFGMDILTAQLTRPVAPPSELVGVPPDVDRVVLRCLAQDSADRFVDVGELAGALDAVLSAPAWKPPASIDLARDTLRSPPREPTRPQPAEAPDTVPQLIPPQRTLPVRRPASPRSLGPLVIAALIVAALALGGGLAWLVSLLGR